MRPEIRLLLATFSATGPSNTGGAVSADVAGVETTTVRGLSYILLFADGNTDSMTDLSAGDFAAALSSKFSQQWSQPMHGDEQLSVPEYFAAIEKHAGLQRSVSDSWQQLQIAVAAFLTFTQANLTG